MRRLLVRPGAIGDCIVSFPALEFLRTDYTEVWVPAPVVPLVQFADRVCSISSTGLDSFGIEGLEASASVVKRLTSFDEIISWYGANRPDFRTALAQISKRCIFLQALPLAGVHEHATDFYTRQVGAPLGLRPRIRTGQIERRASVVIHPFSGSSKKNWSLLRFAELSSALPLEVEWLAGPEEELRECHRFDNLLEAAS